MTWVFIVSHINFMKCLNPMVGNTTQLPWVIVCPSMLMAFREYFKTMIWNRNIMAWIIIWSNMFMIFCKYFEAVVRDINYMTRISISLNLVLRSKKRAYFMIFWKVQDFCRIWLVCSISM